MELREDWAAVATAINQRMAEAHVTQMELASRSGVSLATIRELQHNRNPRPRRHPRTLSAISEALGWPPDHLERVRRGEPLDATEAAAAARDPVLAELHAIREELQHIRSRLDELEGPAGRR